SIFDEKGVSLLFNFFGGMIILFILFGVLSFTSDMLDTRFNLRGIVRGMVLSIPLLTMSVTAYLTGLYLRKKGKYFKLSYLLGLIIMSVAMGILPLCYRSIIVYPIMLGLLGLGSGLVLPAINTMVTSATQSEQRGGVTSLYGSVRFIGVALGPPTFSLLQNGGIPLMFLTGSGLALTAGILGFIFISEQRVMKQSG
ncbi:MAG: MFS transporter, partial [Dethiobacter sp.]